MRALFNPKSIKSNELDILTESLDFLTETTSFEAGLKEAFCNFRNGFPVENIFHEEFAILSSIALAQPTLFNAKLENSSIISDLSGRLSVCLYTQMGIRKDDLSVTKAYTVIIRKMAELFR